MRCINCNSEKIAPLKPEIGDKFFLGSIDTRNSTIHADNGLPVDVIACTGCGMIFLANDKIKGADLIQE